MTNLDDNDVDFIESSIEDALEITGRQAYKGKALITGWHNAAVMIYCAKIIAEAILKSSNKNG